VKDMNSIPARKAELRAACRARLATWTADERERVSRLIGEHAVELLCERLPRRMTSAECENRSRTPVDGPSGSTGLAVLVFTPMMAGANGVFGEIDPSFLAQELLERGVRVCVPRVDWGRGGSAGRQGASRAMTCVEVFDWSRDLEPAKPASGGGASGSPRFLMPRDGLEVVPEAELGAIVTPGLAFDLRGGRLGRGMGFYDRFIASARAASAPPLVVGVCAEVQVVSAVPMDAHDERVDWVVTERGASNARAK
jgi:5-formyltetrahydrofolate cyclo-ligase